MPLQIILKSFAPNGLVYGTTYCYFFPVMAEV